MEAVIKRERAMAYAYSHQVQSTFLVVSCLIDWIWKLRLTSQSPCTIRRPLLLKMNAVGLAHCRHCIMSSLLLLFHGFFYFLFSIFYYKYFAFFPAYHSFFGLILYEFWFLWCMQSSNFVSKSGQLILALEKRIQSTE